MDTNSVEKTPRAGWSAFFLAIIALYLAILGMGTFVMAMQMGDLHTSISLDHCANYTGPNAQILIETCAQNEVAGFMNEPHHMARLLTACIAIAALLGFLFSLWGIRKHNHVMWFSGLAAALWLSGSGSHFYIPCLGLLIGHTLGFLFAKRYAARSN